jgi:hypothetical protein
MSEAKEAYIRTLNDLLKNEKEAEERAVALSKVVLPASERTRYQAAAKAHAAQGESYKLLIQVVLDTLP